MALFNLGEEEAELAVELQAAGMEECTGLTELWTGGEACASDGNLKVRLGAHACAVYGSLNEGEA